MKLARAELNKILETTIVRAVKSAFDFLISTNEEHFVWAAPV